MQHSLDINFIGIGSGKCGSTWLYKNLVSHPEICDANLKELNYFSDLYEEQPFSWYEAQFKGCACGLIRGEFSVTYISHPQAPQRVLRHVPKARILVIVRDPVKRTFSNFLHSQRKGDIANDLPFEQYIQNEDNLAPGRYAEHLERWFAIFPAQQILVVVLEHFLRDQLAGYRSIFEFIGLEDVGFVPPHYNSRSNEARSYRFLTVENLMVRTYRWLSRRGYTRLVKVILDSGMGYALRWLNSGSRELPQIDRDSQDRLARYFSPYNNKLATLLGRDLSCWEKSPAIFDP
jgi:hypothetical protein